MPLLQNCLKNESVCSEFGMWSTVFPPAAPLTETSVFFLLAGRLNMATRERRHASTCPTLERFSATAHQHPIDVANKHHSTPFSSSSSPPHLLTTHHHTLAKNTLQVYRVDTFFWSGWKLLRRFAGGTRSSARTCSFLSRPCCSLPFSRAQHVSESTVRSCGLCFRGEPSASVRSCQ